MSLNINQIPVPLKLAIIILIGFVVYSFMFHAPFKTPDDTYSTTHNPLIGDLANLGKVFKESFFGGGYYYRPLVNASFMFEYQLFGLNPFYYNLDNFILHAMNVVMVFLIAGILLNQSTAFWVSLLFMIHPIQWSSVSVIANRSILLCGFFSFLSFWLFLRFYLMKHHPINLLLSSVAFFLAALTKEAGIMMPFVILLFIGIHEKSLKNKVIHSIQIMFPYMVFLLCYIGIRTSLGFTQTIPWRDPWEYYLGIMSFLRGQLTWMVLLIFPLGLHFDRAQALFMHPFQPEIFLTLAVYISMILLLFIFRKSFSKIVWFLIGWYCIEVLPVSEIVTTINVQEGYISMAEHFLYVPSLALFCLAVMTVEKCIGINNQKQLMSAVVVNMMLTMYLFFLAIMTIAQNIYAQSSLGMYRQTIKYNSYNLRILDVLALESARLGRFDEAEECFRKILAIKPDNVKARIGLAKSLCDQGKCAESLVEYSKITDPGKYTDLLEKNIQQTKEYINKVSR